ncbi:multicopper oxidase type 2 [Streptomyces bingchenggensis BCW-1]|uniref:Multicopper oxidase type 2 n=1 Tax=Streptomyces bingchenggensis (strain BCW-1) TaxID=749414 RepID=D7CD59_STRBB|nr:MULTISPECIES: multicopper oxidase domain-containing protein [Streptomyces]ADI10906.1 multicopper oxidase type 2 [Streptomyces bingchenggensis BCW-1]
MSETTPNSKGPAKTQMSPERLASLGLTPAPEAAAPNEPALIPADQVKPEDVGTLSIEYRDGKPVIVVSGGTYIPATLMVVDGSDNAAGAHAARSRYERYIGDFVLHCHILDHEDNGMMQNIRISIPE